MRKYVKTGIMVAVLVGSISSQAGSIELRAPDFPERNYSDPNVMRESSQAAREVKVASERADKEMSALEREMQPYSRRSLSSAKRAYKHALAAKKQGDMENACRWARIASDTVSGISSMAGSALDQSYAATADEFCNTKAPA